MNKEQAVEAMRKGVKVTHAYFTSEEWATIKDGKVLFEDGAICELSEFFKYRHGDAFDKAWSEFVESREFQCYVCKRPFQNGALPFIHQTEIDLKDEDVLICDDCNIALFEIQAEKDLRKRRIQMIITILVISAYFISLGVFLINSLLNK